MSPHNVAHDSQLVARIRVRQATFSGTNSQFRTANLKPLRELFYLLLDLWTNLFKKQCRAFSFAEWHRSSSEEEAMSKLFLDL